MKILTLVLLRHGHLNSAGINLPLLGQKGMRMFYFFSDERNSQTHNKTQEMAQEESAIQRLVVASKCHPLRQLISNLCSCLQHLLSTFSCRRCNTGIDSSDECAVCPYKRNAQAPKETHEMSKEQRVVFEVCHSEVLAKPRTCESFEGCKNGDRVASTSAFVSVSTPTVMCYSTRIQNMTQRKSQFSCALDAEIDASKDHWSEMSQSNSVGVATEKGMDASDMEDARKANREAFRRLQQQKLFHKFLHDGGDCTDWVLGRKIAEGAQAEIYELENIWDGNLRPSVAKVFKLEGPSLQDLQTQWPREMVEINMDVNYRSSRRALNTCLIEGGLLLADGRFAFKMQRYWGDLRKLLDLRMQENFNQGPPFTYTTAVQIMRDIALGMKMLHKNNILHRDLKASNVLVQTGLDENWDSREDDYVNCVVADYECSIGVVGTRFWKAPEILQALKDKTVNSKPELFTTSADVYSYAMTCYEILTGFIPFEDLPHGGYNLVISGSRRLNWPTYIGPRLKALLERCSHLNPLDRPTSEEIYLFLKRDDTIF